MEIKEGNKGHYLAPEAYHFIKEVKGEDGKTMLDVFRANLMDTLKKLSAELGKVLTLEDVSEVVGFDLSVPDDVAKGGNEKSGKLVNSDYASWLMEKGKLDKTANSLFVPRYLARTTREGKIMRDPETKEVVPVGNFTPIFSESERKWKILAASGNAFWQGSDIHRLRELGLEKENVGKLFPALTYGEAQSFVDRATRKHQGNVARTDQRKSLAADIMGAREHREDLPPLGKRLGEKDTTGKGKRPWRR